ncbi:hypothetical protein O2W15_02165 [Modestobacter sp. VKM Ac-2979]|uniref:hypothetical protein n=1 Tax=unclassified Modestobacter TaxID=2643866 RepID=UPI0022AB9330|nr:MULTISPECIES: hypothetical protein [unclassified Modestobacter]MCZ2810231.1 hypothetical protein [Modestobacter sp. VKM Ac-2979]MCZ2841717.1 hypothetical protein [Modestobacter sp. VKM Ac-2980]
MALVTGRGRLVAIEDVVRKAFEDARASGYEEAFLSEAITNWRECEKSINKTTTVLVLTSAVAELVLRGAASELSIAGIKVTQLVVVYSALPVVIAYLYSSLMFLCAESSMNQTAFDAVMTVRQPTLWRANLERLLYPPNMTFIAGDRLRHGFPRGSKLGKLVDWALGARAILLIILPIAFISYMFVRLFDKMGASNVAVWISLCLSVILVLVGLVGLAAAALVWEGQDKSS